METDPNGAMSTVTSLERKYALYNIRDFTQDRLLLCILTVEKPMHTVLVS